MMCVVALRGGPQPGSIMHPPNPRRWIHGEVQATLQIYPWSNNTRTHGYLEWFGPPEHNTLRPLRVLLLLCVDESILCLPDFFLGLPFIEQGGRVHRRWTPTGGPNEDVYEKDINGASVVENLSPDTLHHPVDSLIEGGLHLSHRRGAR